MEKKTAMPAPMELNAWKNRDAAMQRLAALGLEAEAAAPRRRMLARRATALQNMQGASSDVLAFYVPGRVEVLGKHTDYGGGQSLLTAVERGFCAWRRRAAIAWSGCCRWRRISRWNFRWMQRWLR